MAGIIKGVLVLDRRVIPPYAGLQAPCEAVGIEGSGFYLPTSLRPFHGTPGSPRRVGVNAFGFGGTNVHVVLEEAPQPARQSRTIRVAEPDTPQLFVISAATLPLLAQYLTTLAEAIQKSNAPLRDLAYTLTATRRREDERIAFVASSRSELREKLLGALSALGKETSDEIAYCPKSGREVRRNLGFVFSGQERWTPVYFPNFCYQFPGFRSRLEALAAIMNGTLGKPLTSHLITSRENLKPRTPAESRHSQTDCAEVYVIVAAIQIALTQFVGELGLQPQATLGSGWGESLAAAASGVLPPEAALHLVAELSRDASQRPSPNAHDASGESLGRLQVSLPRIPMISSATCASIPTTKRQSPKS